MTFVVKIEAPGAGQAETAIARVEAGLGKTTAAADKTRDAMGRVVGTSADLAKLAAATEKAAGATKRLAAEGEAGSGVSAKLKKAHDAVIDTLAREADIIERIRGPMREYRADMDALESLYKRNKISAAEYDDELQRLIKTQGTMHGPAHAKEETPSGPSLGGIAGGLASGGVGGALGALPGVGVLVSAIGQVHELIVKYKELEDEYTTLTNNATKFVDAGHSVNMVIDEQVAMSAKLHAKLETTLDLYDAVRDGTDGLNVSHAEQNRLLQSMGEAFILAGKGVENAGGLMQKFSYALASGKMESREFKGIMREVPEIADIWTEHFGMTRVELTKALASGKLGTEDLMQAILAETKALDDNYGKRKATNAQLEEEFRQKERIARMRNPPAPSASGGGEGGESEVYGRANDEAIAREKERVIALKAKRVEMNKMVGVALEQNAALAETAAAAERAGVSIGEFDQGAADATSKAKIFLESVGVQVPNAFGEARNKVRQLLAEVDKIRESKAAEKLAEDVHKLWRELDGVNDVLVAQKKHWDDLTDHAGQLKQAVANSAGAQLLMRGMGAVPGVAITRDDVDNVRALRAATLELDNENNQYAKVTIEAKTRTNEHRDAIADLKGAYDHQKISLKEYTDGLKAAGFEEGAAAKLLHELQEPTKQYEIRLGALNTLLKMGAINTALYNAEIRKLQDTITDFMPPEDQSKLAVAARARAQEKYEYEKRMQEGMRKIDKQYSRPDDPDLAHDIETAKASEELKKKLESKTFTGSFKEMNADAKTFGQILAGEVNGSLDTLNDNLIAAAQGGEVAWGKMAESILADLERILLKQIEIAAITALLNYVSAGAGTAATSSGATGAVVDAGNTARIASPGAYPGTAGTSSVSQGLSARAAPAAPTFVNHIHNHYDKSVSVAAIQSREGASATLNMMRANGVLRR